MPHIATTGPLEALQLELAERGARLFNLRDERRAAEIAGMARQALDEMRLSVRGPAAAGGTRLQLHIPLAPQSANIDCV